MRLGAAVLVVPIVIGCRIAALSRRTTVIRPILGVSSVFRRLILTIGIRTILAGCSRRLVLFVLACGSGFLALCSLRAALPLSIECNFRLFVDGSRYGQIAYPSSIFASLQTGVHTVCRE